MKLVKNLEVNINMMKSLSVSVPQKLRPQQLMGKRLREADNDPNIRNYLQQQRIQNMEREQENWTNTMSSKTRYGVVLEGTEKELCEYSRQKRVIENKKMYKKFGE